MSCLSAACRTIQCSSTAARLALLACVRLTISSCALAGGRWPSWGCARNPSATTVKWPPQQQRLQQQPTRGPARRAAAVAASSSGSSCPRMTSCGRRSTPRCWPAGRCFGGGRGGGGGAWWGGGAGHAQGCAVGRTADGWRAGGSDGNGSRHVPAHVREAGRWPEPAPPRRSRRGGCGWGRGWGGGGLSVLAATDPGAHMCAGLPDCRTACVRIPCLPVCVCACI